MPETDAEKVQRYTECLINGVELKRALKRLFDLDVTADVYTAVDTARFVKRYEQDAELGKYAKRMRDKLIRLGVDGARKRDRAEEESNHQKHEVKRPKVEVEETTDEMFAKAMGGGNAKSHDAPRVHIDYSKYKVTKRTAPAPIPAVSLKREPVDNSYESSAGPSSSSSAAPQDLRKVKKEYVPTPTAAVSMHKHAIPQSASLRADESMFKPRKEQRTVFAGRRKKVGEGVPSLISMCQDVLAVNVKHIEHVGIVPYDLLKPALINATVDELRRILDANPLLVEDADELFFDMVRREFPKYADRVKDGWTWREMYDKLVQRKEKKASAKLDMLTEKFKRQKQEQQAEGRKTMMIDQAHTRVKSKSFFTSARDTQVKMLSTPTALTLSQARKNVKTTGKANLAQITPRGGLGSSSSSRGGGSRANAPKTAPMMAKCLKMLRR